MKKLLHFLFAITVLLAACDKDDDGDGDLSGPEITIYSPTTGQMIDAGDSVLIDIGITDEDMHEYEVRVVSAADTSDHFFEEEFDTHDDNIRYTRKIEVPAVSGHTDMILYVRAEDHDGRETTESVSFAFMP